MYYLIFLRFSILANDLIVVIILQYKDAFLNANPDFKWYKLPAPPLRTLTTRPTNKKPDVGGNDQYSDIANSDYQSSNCTKANARDEDGSIQPGKLADESQIGGLSSLFTPQKTHGKSAAETIIGNGSPGINDDASDPKTPNKQYTELPVDIEQKRKCKADLFCEQKSINTESNNNEQHHLVMQYIA